MYEMNKNGWGQNSHAKHTATDLGVAHYTTTSPNENGWGYKCAANYATRACGKCYKNRSVCENANKHNNKFCGYTAFGACVQTQKTNEHKCFAGGFYPSRNGTTNIGIKTPLCSNTNTQFTTYTGDGMKKCIVCPFGVGMKYSQKVCNYNCKCAPNTAEGGCPNGIYPGVKKTGGCCTDINSAVCGASGSICKQITKDGNLQKCDYGTINCNNCYTPMSKCKLTNNSHFCGNTENGGCAPITDRGLACLASAGKKYYSSISFYYTAKGSRYG
jgi:hypothetical protein